MSRGWVSLEKDTDCAWCTYGIDADDPEGMYQVGELLYCTVGCFGDWERDQAEGVDD
jgi:hypothetical protein